MNQQKEKRVRIPLVASHAYVFANNLVGVYGMPLEVRLKRLTVPGGGCGPRPIHSQVTLRFPGKVVDVTVKTYDPRDGVPRDPIFSQLTTFIRFGNSLKLEQWVYALKSRMLPIPWDWEKILKIHKPGSLPMTALFSAERPSSDYTLELQLGEEDIRLYRRSFDRD